MISLILLPYSGLDTKNPTLPYRILFNSWDIQNPTV